MDEFYILPKLLYISLYSLHGSAIGYIAIFYAEAIKRNPQEIGVLLATPYFVQVVSSPLWTMVADRYPKFQGQLMALLTLLGGSSIMTLLLLADKVGIYSDTMIFWLALYLALMFSFFGSPLTALVDSSVLKLLGDQKILYGNQRLWGSISSGSCIFVVGIMVNSLGIRSSFYIFGIGMICLIVFCLMTRLDNGEAMKIADDEHQMLLNKSEVRGNYAYNPQQQQQQQQQQKFDDTMDEDGDDYVYDQQSRRSSLISNRTNYVPPFFSQHQQQHSSNWRRNSISSHANTLLLDDDDDDDNMSSRRDLQHPLLYTLTATSTTYAAMDAQYEASQVMSIMGQQEYPSIGLALSHIPTVETSMAAFSLIGQQQQDGITSGPVLSLKKSSLKSLRVQTFLMMVLLFGLGYSMISQFLFLVYRNDLGMNPSLMGLTGPLAGVAEVMAFWLSKKLFDRFSVTTLITVAHLMFVFRNLVFMLLKRDDPVCIVIALGLQMINGFCYAMIWTTAVAEVDSFFPEDQRAMAQGILAALFSGLGYGFGCMISGVVYDEYGCRCLFGASGCIVLLGLGIFYIGRSIHSY